MLSRRDFLEVLSAAGGHFFEQPRNLMQLARADDQIDERRAIKVLLRP
jgi:hypothetical protein